MNKNLKLVQLISLATTTCIILSAMMIIKAKPTGDGVSSGKVQAVVEEQSIQKEQLETLKKEYDEKMEIQNKLLKEYDIKLIEHDEMNTNLQTNLNSLTEQIKTTQNQIPQISETTQQVVETVQPTEEVTTQNVATTPQVLTINSADGLNLRDMYSSTSQSVELIPNETPVTVVEGPYYNEGYTWYKVVSPTGNQGWLAQEFTR